MATYVIQFKRGRAQSWVDKNILLYPGEPGFEIDTGKFKIGNGVDKWNDLPYAGGSATLSPDNKSLAIEQNGVLSIYGYQDAKVGQIPIKTSEGLSWIVLEEIAKSGDIKDLKQSQTFELFGGSATELI